MKKAYFLFLTFIFFFGLTNLSAQFIQGELFIKLNNSYSSLKDLEKVLDNLSTKKELVSFKISQPFFIDNATLRNTYHLSYEANLNVTDLITTLNTEEIIEYAEQIPDYEFFYTPNDILAQQWNLQKIQAELAWDFTHGSSNVIVAIVDDAVLLSHQDLNSKIWINTGEIPMNSIDDDGNGYIDDVNGWDAADNDNNPNPFNPTNSSFTHGTHCAGISAAATNNSLGISSIGFNTTIMPVKIAQSSTHNLTGSYIGLQYAIINNANVISMSWGGAGYSNTLQALFDQAYSQGITCIAAAGNSNSNIPMYPASYNHVISVGASDVSDTKASFSNYGSTIDVMAPGVGIYSTLAGSNNSYGNLSGTSMACPLVSGLAALMISYNPSITPDDLEQCLKNSSDNIDALNPLFINQLGAGRINAFAAMQCLKPITANFTSNAKQICQGQHIQYTDLSTNTPTSWLWSFPGGTPSTSTLQNPIITYNSNGIYSSTLIATNPNGTDTITIPSYITVAAPTASMSGSTSLLAGFYASIPVYFSGVPPFNFTYTDGTTNYTVTNTVSNPHFIMVNPTVNTTYSILSMSDANCAGTVSGNTVVTIITGNGGSCTQGAAITFQKAYGGTSNERAHSIQPTTDGGYIVAGETTSFGAGNKDWFVMKISASGIVQWTKTYGSSSTDDGNSITIKQTTDLGFIICGYTEGYGAGSYYDSYIIKIDSVGTIQWEKRLIGSSWDMFRDVIELSNGDFLMTGSAHSYSTGNMDAHVVKISSTGSLVWIKNLGTTGREHSESIIELPGGNYLLSGNTNTTNNSHTNRANSFLIKTTSNGVVIWGKEYDLSTFYTDINETILLNDGNLLSVGETRTSNTANYDIFLLKTDTNGTVIWSKKYGNAGNDIGVNVKEKSNGEIVISAFTNSYGNNNQLILINTDGNGNVVWGKTYGGSSNDELDWWGKPMVLTTNDEIIIAGGTKSYGAGNEDIYLIKTNSCGESFCNEQSVTPTATALNTLASSFNVITKSGGSLVNTTSTIKTINFTNNTLCADTIVTVIFPTCNIDANFTAAISCIGDSTYFTDLSTDSINNIINWLWYFGDGDSLIGVQNPTHLYSSADTFDVKLIIINDANPFCSDTIIKQIIIIDTLIITLPINDTICLGDTTNLGPVSTSCGKAPFSYSWTPSNGLNNSFISNPLASPSITTTYVLTVTDSLGYVSVDSITIFVDSTCCKTFAQITGNSIFCQGDSVQLINNSLLSANATYSWNFGGGIPASYSGYNPPLVFFNTPGIHSVQLIINDSCGIDTGYFNINIFPLPNVSLQNDTVICKMDTIQIGETTISDYTYLWTPGSILSDSTISDPWAYMQSTAVFTLKVTDLISGCINYDTLKIEVGINYLDSINTTICQGDSILLGGNYQFTAGVYSDNLYSITGCDSIVITTLTINPVQQSNQTLSICQGDSIFLGGNYQFTAGVYSDTLQAITGCDSTVISTLTVNPVQQSNQTLSICQGDSIFFGGNYQSSTGIYFDSLQTHLGCDSIIALNLTVIPISQTNQNVSICFGDSILLGGSYQNTTGIYTDSLISISGCDSIVVTNLSIIPFYQTNQNISICSNDSILLGGNYQNISGIYTDSLISILGCDSIVITNLTVNLSYSTNITQTICEGDSLLFGGNYLTVSGNYTNNLQSYLSCDSIISLNLTVNPSFYINQQISICFGDSIMLGGSYQTVSGIYMDSYQTILGCDSIIYTTLNVIPLVNDTLTVNICEGESLFLENNFQTTSGTYTDNFLTSIGCDSIVTTILFVNPLPIVLTTNDTTISACSSINIFTSGAANYSWSPITNLSCINCSNPIANPTETISYIVTGFLNGCSAKDTLNITVDGDYEFIIPNIFTPNRDGFNDLFNIQGGCFTSIDKKIYNRWGQLLFQSNQIDEGWDGTTSTGEEAPEGTYFYIITLETTENNQNISKTYKGYLTLLR